MMKCEGLVPQSIYLGGYTTKSQGNPHGHQKPNTDPKNKREETHDCERCHLWQLLHEPLTQQWTQALLARDELDGWPGLRP